jgi:CRP/FNR family cyclic AMP-dependent transcriptional regulator
MIRMTDAKTTSGAPIDTLRRLPMFNACSDRDLKRIDRISTRVRVDPGRVLCREGELGREFFVVVAGAVTVTRRLRTLNRLGPGEAFGESALIDAGARTATVVAAEPSDLLVFNRAEFASMLNIVPRAEHELLRRAVVRRRELEADADQRAVVPGLEMCHRTG